MYTVYNVFFGVKCKASKTPYTGFWALLKKILILAVFCHESWIFPAGVSFALKQNMYWDGFCAFLPDISGLWGGGGGPNPARISKFGGGGGVFLLEVQYSVLKSLISTCVLSYEGSREDWLLDRICESKKDCWDSIRRTSYPYQ